VKEKTAFWVLKNSESEISPQNRINNQKDKAFCPQMDAKKRKSFVCVPAAHYTLYKAFAFICVFWRSFADDMLFAFR